MIQSTIQPKYKNQRDKKIPNPNQPRLSKITNFTKYLTEIISK